VNLGVTTIAIAVGVTIMHSGAHDAAVGSSDRFVGRTAGIWRRCVGGRLQRARLALIHRPGRRLLGHDRCARRVRR
jgi:hypothetical protein